MTAPRIVLSLAAAFALLALHVPLVHGADLAASAPRDERARIASERAEAEAQYARRERECRARFIVTSCVDDAKVERRKALDLLRARQLVVDEARRRERTAERKAELAEKAAEDARRDRERAAHATAKSASDAASQPPRGHALEPFGAARTSGAGSAASGVSGKARPADAGLGLKPRVRESAATRSEREASSRAAFEARQHEAAEHRDEAVQRATRRMATKAPAAALPIPPPAASAASAAAGRRP